MGRLFANGDDAVMTGPASTNDLCVIDGHNGREDVGRVAVLANIGRLNVCLVLAGCIHPVVTAHAITGDVDVVKIRRQPGDRAMAVVAIVATGDVRRVLASGNNAIMAAAAISQDLGVIDCQNRCKHCRAMAVLTNIGCLYVSGILTGCQRAVVTADAIIGIGCVIESGW